MKITKVQIPNLIKNAALTVPLLLTTSTITAKDTNLNKQILSGAILFVENLS